MSKPTFDQVANGFTYDLSEIQKADIYSMVSEAYDSGHEDGYAEGLDERDNDDGEPEVNEERIAVKFMVDAFDSVTTFDEFKAKYLELVRLDLSYTPPIGLTLFSANN